MPYAKRGNTVIKKDTGEVVGHSQNPEKYMRVLQAVEHGWEPKGGKKIKRVKHHSAEMGSFHDKRSML